MRQPFPAPAFLTTPMGRSVGTLALGLAGGAVFFALNLPLAWMLGAMVATTLAAMRGLRIHVHNPLRQGMVAVLGVMLGSAFHPDLVQRLPQWGASVGLLSVYVALSTWIVFVYFQRVAGFDRPTAYFASAPGGFSVMVEMADSFGGDGRTVALVHGTRIFLIVFIIPFFFRYGAGMEIAPTPAGAPLAEMAASDAIVLILCALLGWKGGEKLRLPASQILGPMILSAAAHLTGLTGSPPPYQVIAAAQVVVGAAIGCRFLGVRLADIRRTLALTVGSTLIMIALCAALALLLSGTLGISAPALTLALAPGGLAEMALVALALGIDVAFVSLMHILRIGLIVLLAPLAYRGLGGREGSFGD